MQHPVVAVTAIGAGGLALAAAVAPVTAPVVGPAGDGLGVVLSLLGKSPEMAAIVLIVVLFLRDRKASVEATTKLADALDKQATAITALSVALDNNTTATTGLRRDIRAYRAARGRTDQHAAPPPDQEESQPAAARAGTTGIHR